MNGHERKLQNWLEKHPEGYYNLPMKDIAEAANTTISAAHRILPKLIAKRDNMLPSEVKQKRFANTQGRIDREKLWSMHQSGMSVADIAFLLDCNEGSVREIIRKEQPFKPSRKVQAALNREVSNGMADSS